MKKLILFEIILGLVCAAGYIISIVLNNLLFVVLFLLIWLTYYFIKLMLKNPGGKERR